MKQLLSAAIILLTFASCKHEKKFIVDTRFTDSLLKNFTPSALIKQNDYDLQFWGGRIDPKKHDEVSESKYAGALAGRFGLLGDINDLRSADSILHGLDAYFNYTQVGPEASLIHNAISQHRFLQADTLLEKARATGLRKYQSSALTFDVDFELGRYRVAEDQLKTMADPKDYGYQFRSSKLWHYKGNVDSAITAMKNAVDIAKDEVALKQSALSNTAD
ncbi:MAG: hypothetical protein ABI091_12465, partial [Ferruginibacter sp.]